MVSSRMTRSMALCRRLTMASAPLSTSTTTVWPIRSIKERSACLMTGSFSASMKLTMATPGLPPPPEPSTSSTRIRESTKATPRDSGSRSAETDFQQANLSGDHHENFQTIPAALCTPSSKSSGSSHRGRAGHSFHPQNRRGGSRRCRSDGG
ncbi:hypothetical protein D9M69_463990 [compost metagenome]